MFTKEKIGLFGLLILVLIGCRSSIPVTYYTLQPQATNPLPGVGKPVGQLSIGIGPLSLPDYLDRPALVTRSSPNQVQIREAHRWAGTLKDEVLRALSENLGNLTDARRVEVLPWSAQFSPDVRVRISIRAFEGEPGGTVNLAADWWISEPGAGGQPELNKAVIEEPVTANNIEALVAAMSRALDELSRQVAESVIKRS